MDWKRKADNLEKANNQNEKLLKELKQKCEQQSLELEEAKKAIEDKITYSSKRSC